MKKTIFTLLMAFTLLFVAKATTTLDTFVLDDFENGQVNFTTTVNVNPSASMDIAVVDNPVKDAVNSSNKVWEWKRYDTGDNQGWAGFWATLTEEIPTGYHRIEIKYLRKNATSQLRIKCAGAISKEFNPTNQATKTDEWETIVFDIYANGIKNITTLSLFPDYYTPVDVNAIAYIDDITIVYDESIVPPTPPTKLTLFDNSASDLFRDQSWMNTTAPSTVTGVLWSDPTQPGDKLPVVTSPVKAGANALKLEWNSATGGNWEALVAGLEWAAFDVSTMTHLRFWVNSPVDLVKTALPKIYLQSHSGTPNITGNVELGNYVSNLTANTWTQVIVPLADFWAADPTFTAKDVIKGLFFSQNAADNAAHILYLDEITFNLSTVVPGEVTTLIDFGSNSAALMSTDNWNNVTDNQAANVALIDNQGDATGATLLVTDPFYNGYNTSGASLTTGDAAIFPSTATSDNFFGNGGVFGTTVANPEGIFTISGLDATKYYSFTIFASRANVTNIRDAQYTITGAGAGKSAVLNASNNESEVVKIMNIMPTSAGVITFKTEAGPNNTSAEKFYFLGAVKMTETGNSTSVINPSAEKALNGYYQNGVLRIDDYTGIVKVYNVAGKLISEGQSVFGYMSVKLEKGIYIANTSLGNIKLIAK
ncbi:MAG: hypothetical protein PHS59_12885 [Paludibacter sp.]|nr:hypothetical protein [Paludibacter sp.]